MGDLVAIMRDGRLVQCDAPDRILARPANGFVADFVGADRALKRLSLVTAGELCEAGVPLASAPAVPRSASLRDALATMLEHGIDAVRVVNEAGQTVGVLNLERVRQRATGAGSQASLS